jgi:hypothetical protein
VHHSRRRYAVASGGVFGTRWRARSIDSSESRAKKSAYCICDAERGGCRDGVRVSDETARGTGKDHSRVQECACREAEKPTVCCRFRVSVIHRTNASIVNQARRVALRGAKTARAEDQIRHLMFSSSRGTESSARVGPNQNRNGTRMVRKHRSEVTGLQLSELRSLYLRSQQGVAISVSIAPL